MLYSFLFFHSKPLTNHGTFPYFFIRNRYFSYFCLCFEPPQGGLKQNLLTKAFSGRFGFDALELSNFKLIVKNKATRTPHLVTIYFVIYSSGVGFSALLVSTIRAMRRPQQVERASELAPRLFSWFLWLREPDQFYWLGYKWIVLRAGNTLFPAMNHSPASRFG